MNQFTLIGIGEYGFIIQPYPDLAKARKAGEKLVAANTCHLVFLYYNGKLFSSNLPGLVSVDL